MTRRPEYPVPVAIAVLWLVLAAAFCSYRAFGWWGFRDLAYWQLALVLPTLCYAAIVFLAIVLPGKPRTRRKN